MYGYEPRTLPLVISETHIPAAESRIKELSEARNKALAAHDIAHKVMKDRSTAKFSPFQKGDKVWLEAHNLKCLYENHKFAPKQEGPFLIFEVLSPITYGLAIPMKWKIHNTFHTSLLSPYHENNMHGPNYTRPPPDLIKGEEEYEVKAILSHWGSARNRLYLVRWKGYSSADDSWEPETHLEHAAGLLTAYKRQHPKAFPSRTTTSIVSINRISLDMPATHTTPFACRLRQPTHEQVLRTHKLFLDDSLHTSPLFLALDPDSPLYLVYHAALQSFRVENLAKYLDESEPNLRLTKTILRTIAMELVPDLMQLFDQLGGTDLIYNIRNAHTSPSTHPSGGESASSSDSSVPLPVRVRTPQCGHSRSVVFEVPLAGTRQCTNPSPPGSPANPIDIDLSSSSEVDPEKAFGINPFRFEATLQHIEELHSDPPQSSPVLGPLDHLTPRTIWLSSSAIASGIGAKTALFINACSV